MITLDKILSPDNVRTACKRGIVYKGVPGVGGMTVNNSLAHFISIRPTSDACTHSCLTLLTSPFRGYYENQKKLCFALIICNNKIYEN